MISAKIKSEIYIGPIPSNDAHLSVNIFSRVKLQWVYNDQVRINDVLFLLNDFQVTPANALIRMAPETELYEEFLAKGFEVKVFAGVTKEIVNIPFDDAIKKYINELNPKNM